MAHKLKIIETNEGARLSGPEGVVADIVPAPAVPESDPGPRASTTCVGSFEIAPTRKRHAGWNCRGQLVRATGEHANERQPAPRFRV